MIKRAVIFVPLLVATLGTKADKSGCRSFMEENDLCLSICQPGWIELIRPEKPSLYMSIPPVGDLGEVVYEFTQFLAQRDLQKAGLTVDRSDRPSDMSEVHLVSRLIHSKEGTGFKRFSCDTPDGVSVGYVDLEVVDEEGAACNTLSHYWTKWRHVLDQLSARVNRNRVCFTNVEKEDENPNYYLYQGSPYGFKVGGREYVSGEQYTVAAKALMAGEHDILRKIMRTPEQTKLFDLGRQIKHLNFARWDVEADDIVFIGALAKYASNADIRERLLATGDQELVFVDGEPGNWGVKKDLAHCQDPANAIEGRNRLGKILMKVRSALSVL